MAPNDLGKVPKPPSNKSSRTIKVYTKLKMNYAEK